MDDIYEVSGGNRPAQSTMMYMVLLMGMTMMDYMATFFTLPLLWTLLGGSLQTYGLILGLYPLSRALFSPVFGFLSDKVGAKIAICVCLVLMVSGNVLFIVSTTFVNFTLDDLESGGVPKSGGGIALLIGARLFAGMGTASLSLVTSYLLHAATTDEEKISANNKSRIAGMLGATAGNCLTLGCLYIPHNHHIGGLMVNGITVPVFVLIVLELGFFVGACFFVAPLNKHEEAVGLFRSEESKKILKQTLLLNVLAMFASLALFLYFSQLVPISSSFYHLVDGPSELWKAFLPMLIGSVLSMIVSKKLVARAVPNLTMMKGGALVGAVGCGFLFAWKGSDDYGIAWFFFIGGGIFFMGNGLFNAGNRASLSRVIEKSNYVSTLMGWLYISSGIGSFLGSTIGSLFLSVEPNGSTDCTSSDPLGYSFGCVDLKGLNGLVGFILAACLLLFGGVVSYDYYMQKLGWKGEESEEEPLVLNY